MREVKVDPIRAIDRTFDILNVFTTEQQSITIEEIASKSGLPKTTVYRILYTLERRNIINYNEKTAKYKLGLKLLEYSSIITSLLDIRQESEDTLIELQMKTRQTVVMTVMEDDMMVYIFKRENSKGLKFSSYLGQRRPPLYGVLGFIWLAFLPKEQTDRLLSNPIPQQTPNTITDKNKILERIEKIKKDGVFVEANETTNGVTGIGSPVFNNKGEIVAAVAVIGPSVQLVDEELQNAKKLLMEATREISQRMGHLEN